MSWISACLKQQLAARLQRTGGQRRPASPTTLEARVVQFRDVAQHRLGAWMRRLFGLIYINFIRFIGKLWLLKTI